MRIDRIVVVALALAVGGFSSSTAVAQQQEAIEVGAFFTLTGKFARLGEVEKNGMLLAVEDINASGGVAGRQFKAAIEDSGDSNTTAVNAARKLVEGNYVALRGAVIGTQLLAAFPIIQDAKIPLLVSSGTRKITQLGNPWVFRFSAHDGISKPALVKFASENLKVNKVAIIYESDEYGQSGKALLAEAMKQAGMQIVAEISVDAGERDLSAYILRIKNSGADVVFSQVHDNIMGLFLKQAKRLNLTIPHLASSVAGNATLQRLVTADEIEGIYYEYFFDPVIDPRPEVQDWVKRYKAKHGIEPDAFVAMSYDQIMMLAKVIEKYGADRAAIQKGFREMSYNGLVTEYRADREQSMNHTIRVMQYGKDKKAQVVREITVPFEPYK